jgi:hypothetical protein
MHVRPLNRNNHLAEYRPEWRLIEWSKSKDESIKYMDEIARRVPDAFALNSFLAIRPHPLRDGVTLQGWPSAGMGEVMPDVTSRFIWAIERGNKFL